MGKVIQIPFRQYLPAKESKFHVDIPRQYQDESYRFYSFSSLSLVPEYYSQEAKIYEIESSEEKFDELQEVATLDFQFLPNVFISEKKEYVVPNEDVKLGVLMQSINNHYEIFRPSGIARSPFFFDWYHESMDHAEVLDQSFFEVSSYLFYQQVFNEERHGNALPISVRTLPGVVNYLYPTVTDPEIIKGIRIVLNIAPNTVASFSNEKLLTAMGFSAEQIGPRAKGNRYYLENRDSTNYLKVVADTAPHAVILKAAGASATKISLAPVTEIMTSPEFTLRTSKLHLRNPNLLATDWNKYISEAALKSNVIFGLEYNTVSKQFHFKYPSNNYIKVNIRVSEKMAQRLGFNTERITDQSVSSVIVADDDITNNEKKARALIYSTGQVIVTFDNLRSNTTSGTLDEYMGLLEEQFSGVLKKERSKLSPAVQLPKYSSRLYFTLLYFDPSQKPLLAIKPLDWSVGAYIEGELTGQV